MVVVLRFVEENKYTFMKFQMASSDYKCGEFEITEQKIVMPCLSKKDRHLYLCQTDYRNEDLSLCEMYKFDIELQEDFDLDILNIKINYYNFQNLNYAFIINFTIKNRPLDDEGGKSKGQSQAREFDPKDPYWAGTKIFQQFFFIGKNLKMMYTVPIENFFVVEMNMIAYNNLRKRRKFVVTVKNKNKTDLITFDLDRGVMDIDTMRNGYLLGGIDFVKTPKGRIILLDLDRINNDLYIIVHDIEKLSTKKIVLPKQLEIIICDTKDFYMFLQTRNTRFGIENNIVNLVNGRIFKSNFFNYDPHQKLLLFSRDNKYYIHRLKFTRYKNVKQSGKRFPIEMSLAQINDMSHMHVSYHSHNLGRFARLKNLPQHEQQNLGRHVDSMGQSIYLKKMHLLNKKIKVLDFHFSTVELNYIYFDAPSPVIQGRTFNFFSYYIKVVNNNLRTNQNDPSVLWFNYLNNRFSPQAQKQLEGCTVIFSFLDTKQWFFCAENVLIARKVVYLPSEDPLILDRFKSYRLAARIFDQDDKPEDFQFQVYLGQYLLVIKKGIQLVSIRFKNLSERRPVKFDVSILSKGKFCRFVGHIVWCFSKVVPRPDSKNLKGLVLTQMENSHFEGSIYLELFMKSGQVFTRKIMSFVPNMENLVYSGAFYMSEFEESVFFTFTDRSGNFYSVKSDKKGYKDKINLPFLKKEMFLDLHFSEITYDSFVILYDNRRAKDLQVWVYSSQSVLYYPAMEYMTEYEGVVTHKVDKLSGTFSVVYRSSGESVRCILFNYNRNPMKRVLRDFEIFKNGCPAQDIFHDLVFYENYLYLSFYCLSTNEYKVFISYIYYGVSLKIEYKKYYYDFSVGRINKDFTFNQTDYYDNIHVQPSPVVYKNRQVTREKIPLESQGLLRLQGDVVKIVMTSDNPYATFYQRITQVDSQSFIHKHKISKEAHFTVMPTLGGHIRVVTDEFIITDYDQQFNNYYYDCEFVRFQAYDFFHMDIDTMYMCKSLKGSFYVFTDFKRVKISVRKGLGNLQPISPDLILVRDSLFICHKTPGDTKVTVSKYVFDNEDFHLIKFVSNSFISSDETSTTFEELSEVKSMYYPEHDMIYFLFDLMHSKHFKIQGFNVGGNFVSMRDNYKLDPEDDTIPLFYLK